MTYYMLIIFAMECGIPCESIEERYQDKAGNLLTYDRCRVERRAVMHRYLMEKNELVWAVCRPEG